MAELKTKPTKESVKAFLSKVADPKRKKDCKVILDMMADVTGAKPEMWGPSIVGFGRINYKYESGRELEWMLIGFSPRKSDLTLYLMGGIDQFPKVIEKLGKYKTGKGCLYLKNLEDVNLKALRELMSKSVEKMADKRIDK